MNYLRETGLYRLWKLGKARLAVMLYGDPSRDMVVIGVTGTDGKTTTCRMLHHVLQSFGKKTIVIGTTGVKIGDTEIEGIVKMTSYDPMDLQRLLARARDEGCTHAVLEVSSHGLVQERFLGISFTAAALTNITPEHLDYHKTMAAYAEAKKKLFRLVEQNVHALHTIAVLPLDNTYARQWMEQIHVDRMIDYSAVSDATLCARDIREHLTHTTATIETMGKSYQLELPLVGKFNVANCLAVIGICMGLELPIEEAIVHLKTMQPVQGRQHLLQHNGVTYVIDFAHTPNGLEVMLQWLRACQGELMSAVEQQNGLPERTTSGRLWCLFGAPGERDVAKRPEMGKVVERYADMIVLTDDDAAGENRRKILGDVKAGISREQGVDFFVIPERREAIRFVIDHVQPGDLVLFAGKGHESVLVTNFGKVPWGEAAVLAEELKSKELVTA